MPRLPSRSIDKDLFQQLKDEEVLFVSNGSKIRHVPLIISGLLVFALVYWLSYDFRWSIVKTGLLATLVIVGSFALVIGIRAIISILFGKYPKGISLTNDAVLFFSDRSVDWFLLTDLINVDHKHHYKGRSYDNTIISLQFTDEKSDFLVNDIDKAEQFVDSIVELKNKALARSVSNSHEGASEIISRLLLIQDRTWVLQKLVVAGATLGISALVLFPAIFLNLYFDDSLSWEKAVSENKASSYRAYIRSYQSGRFKTDATARLKKFYDEAESRYRSLMGDDYDEEAVSAVVALLRNARETHEYQVGVTFERTANIPADLVEQVKAEFEVNKVLPVGTAFTDEKMQTREFELLSHIRNSFQKVFQDDVLEIVDSCSNACPKFTVRYETSFLDSIFYDVKEEDIKYEDRNWTAGIIIEWFFELNIAEEKQSYSFNLESVPAESIFYDTQLNDLNSTTQSDADQNSLYDAMVRSSFEDFSAHLAFNLGLGPEPHLDDEKMKEAEEAPKTEKKLLSSDTKQL